MLLNDGIACLIVRDAENTSVGLIETDDEAVVSWVRETFEAYRQEARRVTTENLSALATGAAV